ncbi:SgcJ/EcaC family oxidoreductase [Nocardia cyriacigeorgica]|uniref:SgcJ/EcaC family oxidoreductase n=1 Tax=Nocardia cyriacigeorgica TaxID=135487 RepID=A0A6P1D2N6_9NOCA|nr:SgcJ/EcaC family oxidoreductase [Nocardia cyriacigeorgica]NEW38943.1 SgcJ/EcaC family oxidoreductase [Nocardia cyriacigeorgica]NEW43769.1 SgcJ/EcaC family oxidoreductase [Nocardia cyriacigeorgica]NEW50330.1 SgcJ/EcaC family oxidoreductase [Nocardia cyriacigeorgica]NEW54930.1 SgcJ/EcaC family oxidoreductase [Nocardia cyriacigeorgica]
MDDTVSTRSIARPSLSTVEPEPTAAAEIEALFRRLEAALIAKDAAAFDDVFTEDIVFINPAGRIFRSWSELHSYHRAVLGKSPGAQAHYDIIAIRHLTAADAIVNIEQTLRTPDFSITNRGTWVLIRRDGAWWVCSAHNTNVAETMRQIETANE